MKALKTAKLTPLEHHIWNTIEDWRVEKLLGDIFPGCRQNFEWLIRHMFDRDQEGEEPIDLEILNWLLLELRSWSVPELEPKVHSLELRIETELTGLIPVLRPILSRIKVHCPDTKTAIAYAREIVELLEQWAEAITSPELPSPGDENPTNASSDCETADEVSTSNQSPDNNPEAVINTLLNRPSNELPQGLGETLGRMLNELRPDDPDGVLRVAEVCPRNLETLSSNGLEAAKQINKPLKYKLQSLLQAMTLKKVKPGHRGRLDTKTLHKLFVADPKIFRQAGLRVGHNTAIHLLIDASGSMSGSINLVSQVAYSLCLSLSETPGINVGASVFPGQQTRRSKTRDKSWDTVSPILRHGQALHHKFQLEAEGGTPMGEAIWWALQEMAPLRVSRKMIVILTDGEPDHISNTNLAIAEAEGLGYELYGLGIGETSIKSLLPGQSAEITHLSELPRKLFELLGQVIHQTT